MKKKQEHLDIKLSKWENLDFFYPSGDQDHSPITLKIEWIQVGPRPIFSFFHDDPTSDICIILQTDRRS